jgi:hypothetical protein
MTTGFGLVLEMEKIIFYHRPGAASTDNQLDFTGDFSQ